MPPRESTGKRSPLAEARAQVDALKALVEDPPAQRDLALGYVKTSKNMEVLRPALTVLQEQADPAFRPVLHDKWAWCDKAPEKHDSGGFVRASIIRAVQPIILPDDLPILQRALTTYEMVGLYEVAAEVRAAALNALADLDPDLASLYAARFLRDPLNSMSGEPALSAVRLLAAQQQLAPLFGMASWSTGLPEGFGWNTSKSEIIGEALRCLVDLPASLVPLLIAEYEKSEDEQVLLGLFDLILGHPQRSRWQGVVEEFLRTTRMLDLYALVVAQIVASRDMDLIAMLRSLVDEERDRVRYEILVTSLEHA